MLRVAESENRMATCEKAKKRQTQEGLLHERNKSLPHVQLIDLQLREDSTESLQKANRLSFGRLNISKGQKNGESELEHCKENLSMNRQWTQVDDGVKKCQNHHEKMATYFAVGDDHDTYYCQKCAILIASQGFLVNKLKKQTINSARVASSGSTRYSCNQHSARSSPSINRHMRQTEVKSLVTCLEVTLKQLQSKQSNLKAIFRQQRQQYAIDINQLDEYFEKLREGLDDCQSRCRTLLSEQNLQQQQLEQSIMDLLSRAIDKSLQMREDLMENMEVVFSTPNRQFREIVQNYLANNRNFSSFVQQWKESDLKGQRLILPPIEQLIQAIQDRLSRQKSCREQTNLSSMYFSFDGSSGTDIGKHQMPSLGSTMNVLRTPNQTVIMETPMLQDSSNEDSDLLE